jgi:hypothetical protein
MHPPRQLFVRGDRVVEALAISRVVAVRGDQREEAQQALLVPL